MAPGGIRNQCDRYIDSRFLLCVYNFPFERTRICSDDDFELALRLSFKLESPIQDFHVSQPNRLQIRALESLRKRDVDSIGVRQNILEREGAVNRGDTSGLHRIRNRKIRPQIDL